jgi:hypothetical protein
MYCNTISAMTATGWSKSSTSAAPASTFSVSLMSAARYVAAPSRVLVSNALA